MNAPEDLTPSESQKQLLNREIRRKKPARKNLYSQADRVDLFRYLLAKIRSDSPENRGKVAKKRVNPNSETFWEQFAMEHMNSRKIGDFIQFYNCSIESLPVLAEFTLEQKADLYFALDIRVPKSLRQPFIDRFGVELDEIHVITGSTKLTHWEIAEKCDDADEEAAENRFKKVLFTEKEDGLMWKHALETAQRPDTPISLVALCVWRDFTRKYRDELPETRKRGHETYRQRFYQTLVPNLHKMPFDTQTKAFLFQTMRKTVPEEWRATISRETGAILSEEGRIVEWPDRPARFELQSRPVESLIGISSALRPSTLNLPNFSLKPFDSDETRAIWAFLVDEFRDSNGKAQRAKSSYTGQVLWKKFIEKTGSERSWQSLAHYFSNTLLAELMSIRVDLKTKLDLHFSLRLRVEPPVLAQFETITSLIVLNKLKIIQYAESIDGSWRLGLRPNTVEAQEKAMENHVSNAEIEARGLRFAPNSILFPYVSGRLHRRRVRKTNQQAKNCDKMEKSPEKHVSSVEISRKSPTERHILETEPEQKEQTDAPNTTEQFQPISAENRFSEPKTDAPCSFQTQEPKIEDNDDILPEKMLQELQKSAPSPLISENAIKYPYFSTPTTKPLTISKKSEKNNDSTREKSEIRENKFPVKTEEKVDSSPCKMILSSFYSLNRKNKLEWQSTNSENELGEPIFEPEPVLLKRAHSSETDDFESNNNDVSPPKKSQILEHSSSESPTSTVFEQDVKTEPIDSKPDDSPILTTLEVVAKQEIQENPLVSADESIDRTFCRIESHIREFCRRLRANSAKITPENRVATEDRLDRLVRNFRLVSKHSLSRSKF